jgi:hypothetical protein
MTTEHIRNHSSSLRGTRAGGLQGLRQALQAGAEQAACHTRPSRERGYIPGKVQRWFAASVHDQI